MLDDVAEDIQSRVSAVLEREATAIRKLNASWWLMARRLSREDAPVASLLLEISLAAAREIAERSEDEIVQLASSCQLQFRSIVLPTNQQSVLCGVQRAIAQMQAMAPIYSEIGEP